jgi:hypothetical protein
MINGGHMKNKTNIKKVIRQIVREEVAMAIGEVVNELKQPSLSSQQVSQPKPQKKIVEKKQYTENSVLNDVLNETANSDEWKTMGGGKFDSSKMNEIVGKSYGDMMSDTPSGNLAAEMGVNPNEAPEFLTKDYKAVMKALNKKDSK